jgi:hypothetical protein
VDASKGNIEAAGLHASARKVWQWTTGWANLLQR